MAAEDWKAIITTTLTMIVILATFEWLTIREERRYAEALAKRDFGRAEYHGQRARVFAIFCRRKGSVMLDKGEGN